MLMGNVTGLGRYILTCILNHHDHEQPDLLLQFLHLVALRLLELRIIMYYRRVANGTLFQKVARAAAEIS